MRIFARVRAGLAPALLLSASALAASGGSSTTAFLKIGLAARPAAMGDASVAVGGDVQGLSANPGGMAAMDRAQAGLSYASWLKGTSLQQVTFGMPMGSAATIGVNVQMLSSGGLTKTVEDAGGNLDTTAAAESFTASSLAAGLLIGRRVSDEFSIGTQLKFIQDTIDTSKASGFGADIGMLWKGNHFRFGASAVNLGPKLKDEALPSAVRVGAAIQPVPDATMALDVVFPGDSSKQRYGLGAEYWVMKSLALRGGYRFAGDAASNTPTAGVGINLAGATLDYALAMFGNDLGQTHRVTLAYAFGQPRKSTGRAGAATPSAGGPSSPPVPKVAAPAVAPAVAAPAPTAPPPPAPDPNASLKRAKFAEGQDLFKQGRYVQSIAAFEDILKVDPNHQASIDYIEKAKQKAAGH